MIGFLSWALPALGGLLLSNPWITLLGAGALATYGIGKMLGKDKVSENLAEEKEVKMNALVGGGIDSG